MFFFKILQNFIFVTFPVTKHRGHIFNGFAFIHFFYGSSLYFKSDCYTSLRSQLLTVFTVCTADEEQVYCAGCTQSDCCAYEQAEL
ncbi:hypothetical protein C0J52_05002 [Blattella germanica]|nr:hypothetical protein C0J52_05002 [Blattella germanica]